MIQRGGALPMDVLRAGTINSARKFGVDRSLGSLEVGKFADFLVLYGNPLQDMHNTANIKYVVTHGVLYDSDSMTQLWPRYQRLPKMGWQTPELYQHIPEVAPLRP